jgi:hypothetical protein
MDFFNGFAHEERGKNDQEDKNDLTAMQAAHRLLVA